MESQYSVFQVQHKVQRPQHSSSSSKAFVPAGGIGTDTGCAGCRWVEIPVEREKHTHTDWLGHAIFYL